MSASRFEAEAVDPGWTPALSADGKFYCSPRCGGGRFCRKEWHDRAVAEANAMCAALGPGWEPIVSENLGWHARAKCGCVTVYNTSGRFSAWVEPDIVINNMRFQIIAHADTPEDALGFATQDARSVISKLEGTLQELYDIADRGRPVR